MAIRVVRNSAGNCINFIGTSNPAYWNACLSASLNSEDNTRIDIVNDIRTASSADTVYEFYAVPFSEFRDADDNSFANATAAMTYINANANVASNTGSFTLSASDTLDFSTDDTNTTVLVDNGDSYAVNSIQAVLNDDGHITINKHGTQTAIFTDLRIANASIDGAAVSSTGATAVNELNALFSQTGSAVASAPVFTSQATYNINTGDSINLMVAATGGVGFEYSSLPTGLAVNSLNRRNVIGSIATAGTYTFDVTAVNHFGSVTQTVTLNVSSSFSNTKGVSFGTSMYLGANAALLDATLGRSANGAGSGDAWTISLWVKPATISGGQTIFYYGSADTTNGGLLDLRITSSGKLRFQYGSANNHIRLTSTNVEFSANTWTHLLVSYDGGTTGASSADVNNYYGRFGVYIDGAQITTVNTHNNYGWSGAVSGQNLRVGRLSSGNYLTSGTKVEEIAIWSSDQSGNVSAIYNSGTPFDLTTLTTGPAHWWRMGDGDTYSVIQDNVGTAHFVMYNMTASNIVNVTIP